MRCRFRKRPKWRLIRWQSGWALLIALPQIVQKVRCFQTLVGVKVNSEFSLLTMNQSGTQWHPIAEFKGQLQVSLTLPSNWRVSGSPKTVHLQGRKWLLLPISFGF
ncbi:MAG: hypothetical protein NZ805_09570 [Armatimonadetes bacterium]|nr:hypothetical protein [Armatimonadota bacterium]MDW8027940.1 hypothetical protein [Armatimonadota bacterium]